MLKHLWICAAFAALGASPLYAQEQEAVLQTVQVPGAGFDLVLATRHPEGGTLPDLGNTPEALIVHLQGADLAVLFEDVDKMVEALDSFKRQVGTIQGRIGDDGSLQPVAVYAKPKSRGIPYGEQMTDTREANPTWQSRVSNDTMGLP